MLIQQWIEHKAQCLNATILHLQVLPVGLSEETLRIRVLQYGAGGTLRVIKSNDSNVK